MNKVKIDYSEINSSAKRAKLVSGWFEDYADDVEKRVVKKLSGLSGSDSAGNISNAKSVISGKVKELRNKKNYYNNLSTNLEKLADNIENHENKVVKNVRRVATNALELKNQSKWKAFTQWAYGTFCVDMVNWNPITRGIGNGIKSGLDWVQEKGSKVVDWFKHGNGKYYLEITMDVLAIFGAVAGTVKYITLAVAATVATAVTGGATTPLVVAAIASTIGTVMLIVDKGFSIVNKIKAKEIELDTGDPGQARYYGNINGVNDIIKKRDFGGKTANNVMGAVGKGYNTIRTTANITAGVSGTVGAAGLNGQMVKDPVTGKASLKTTYDPTKIKSNLKNTMLERMGFKNTKGKWTFDVKNLITIKKQKTGINARTDILKKDLLKEGLGDNTYKRFKTLEKINEFPQKIYRKIDNTEKLFNSKTSGYKRVKSVITLLSDSKFAISAPVKDLKDTVFAIADTVIN